jgi:hypothetical protein
MAQKGLEFITVRDAFLIAKDEKGVDELQLNDRVKRILKMRLQDYTDWKGESETELRMRKRVERAYLISEVDSLKLYSKWAKPYLKAAQRLQFEDVKLNDPELIQAFDQNFIELKIRAKKEYRLKEFFAKGTNPRSFSPPASWSKEKQDAYKKEKFGPPVYGLMEVTFQYRTKPTLVSQSQTGGGAYRVLGKLNIKFESYFLTTEEYDLLEKQEDSEALKFIEGMTQETLDAMQKDIELYIDEEKEEQGKAKPKKKDEKKGDSKQKPLLEQFFGGWGTGFGGFGGLFDTTKYTQAMLSARAKISEDIFTVYDIFKKSQGLLSFPYYPEYKTPKAGK